MKLTKIALSLSLFCGLTYVAVPAHAQYGTAGCGLGGMIIGDKPGFVQVFAATLNGIVGNQTFGISSGTLGCNGGAPSVATAKAFVETNREALAKDIARGQGETITSLSTLAGCQDSKVVGAALQSDFAKIFPKASVSDKQVSSSVVDVLKAHSELSCKKLS